MDDEEPAPSSGGSGGTDVDSGGSDSGGAAGATESSDAVERSVGLVLAAPDLPPQFVCLGGFEADEDGNPTGDPVLAGGPFGIPDRTDPAGLKLSGGFPYGTVVRLPVRERDRRFFDGLVPIGFVVDDVSPRAFAGAGNFSEACARAWPQARDMPARQLRMAELPVGGTWIAGVSGCTEASSGAACAGGDDLQLSHGELDRQAPTTFHGRGDSSLTLQVANLATDESLQNVDLYLQPKDGEPISLGTGLSRGDTAREAVGVRLESDTLDEALLLVVPHGEEPCVSDADCATLAVPIQPSLERYGSPMGGATGAAWAGHQVLALFGRAPQGDETAATTLRLGIFEASLP